MPLPNSGHAFMLTALSYVNEASSACTFSRAATVQSHGQCCRSHARSQTSPQHKAFSPPQDWFPLLVFTEQCPTGEIRPGGLLLTDHRPGK